MAACKWAFRFRKYNFRATHWSSMRIFWYVMTAKILYQDCAKYQPRYIAYGTDTSKRLTPGGKGSDLVCEKQEFQRQLLPSGWTILVSRITMKLIHWFISLAHRRFRPHHKWNRINFTTSYGILVFDRSRVKFVGIYLASTPWKYTLLIMGMRLASLLEALAPTKLNLLLNVGCCCALACIVYRNE